MWNRFFTTVRLAQSPPQHETRIGVVRAKLNGVREQRNALGESSLLREQRAEIVERFDVLGLDPQHVAKELGGLAHPARLCQQRAEIEQGQCVLRVESQCGAQRVDRFAPAALSGLRQTEIGPGLRALRLQPQRFAIVPYRSVQISEHGQRDGEVEVRDGVAGVSLERLSQVGGGFGRTSQRDQRVAEIAERFNVRGIQLQGSSIGRDRPGGVVDSLERDAEVVVHRGLLGRRSGHLAEFRNRLVDAAEVAQRDSDIDARHPKDGVKPHCLAILAQGLTKPIFAGVHGAQVVVGQCAVRVVCERVRPKPLAIVPHANLKSSSDAEHGDQQPGDDIEDPLPHVGRASPCDDVFEQHREPEKQPPTRQIGEMIAHRRVLEITETNQSDHRSKRDEEVGRAPDSGLVDGVSPAPHGIPARQQRDQRQPPEN